MSRPLYAKARIMALLKAGEAGTVEEIGALVFKSRQSVGPILKQLHEQGVVRVIGWRRINPKGRPQRVFALANGKPDAPLPEPLSSAVTSKRYRSAIKRDLGTTLGLSVLRAIQKKKSAVIADGRVVYRRGEGVRRIGVQRDL